MQGFVGNTPIDLRDGHEDWRSSAISEPKARSTKETKLADQVVEALDSETFNPSIFAVEVLNKLPTNLYYKLDTLLSVLHERYWNRID